MKRVAAVFTTVAIAATAVTVLAQAKPNLGGRWIQDRPAAREGGGGDDEGGGGRGGGAWGGANQTITITQDATKMTVAYPQGPNNVTVTYDLTGAPTKNTVPGNFGPVEQTSTAAWQGDALVITTGQQKRTVSIQNQKLVVETTTAAATPAPGARGGAAGTSRTTYTKAPDAPARGGGRGGRGGEAGGARGGGDPD